MARPVLTVRSLKEQARWRERAVKLRAAVARMRLKLMKLEHRATKLRAKIQECEGKATRLDEGVVPPQA